MKLFKAFALKIKKQPLNPVNKRVTAICKLALKFSRNCPKIKTPKINTTVTIKYRKKVIYIEIEVLALWYEENGNIFGYIVATDDQKLLMEREKKCCSFRELLDCVKRLFIDNNRFLWDSIEVSRKNQYVRICGIDKQRRNLC